MNLVPVVVFAVVYAGMVGGGLPFLQLDRTGIALLGAIALVAFEVVSPEAAAGSVHLPTMVLLFSFMVVSAHLQVSGFYGWVTRWIAALPLRPPALLAALMAAAAALSAVFSNDVICLAMAPILADAAARRGLAPVPFLLGLACAANVGSAATLIGNPQNMLIGSALKLSFGGYFFEAIGPVLVSLAVAWGIVAWQARGRWSAPAGAAAAPADHPRVNPWQTSKGLALTLVLLVVFLDGRWPREVAALTAAGLLLLSRRMHSQEKLGLVDWELLVLFFGLFVVNHAFEATGIPARFVADLAAAGFDIARPAPLFVTVFGLSNVVSNVPAVMLLLPWARHPEAGPLLALVSTLAGNLLIVGSVANIIVVDAAAARGIRIGWRTHARVGVPVTLATLGVTALFLAM
ncbi:MAG TPA: anion transporter [Anaeromyxobacter sp.]|nr:anion transporter [Anaeromyxobacter sp.]